MTLRQIYFLQCAFFNWVGFADPKAPNFRFWPHFDEVDFVDLEVPILFLQCAFFDGADFDDPEAPI